MNNRILPAFFVLAILTLNCVSAQEYAQVSESSSIEIASVGSDFNFYSSENLINGPELKATECLNKKNNCFLLEWNQVANAQNYRIQISLTPDFNNVTLELIGVPETFIISDELNRNEKYYWRVRGESNSLKGRWSDTKEISCSSL